MESQSTPLDTVSVIIPVYNQLHFTEACLDTLEGDSKRPPYEIIIIDNGSTDGTRKFLEQEARRLCDPNDIVLKLIFNETNRGVAPAWNQGLASSTGAVIAILNNDLHLSEGWMAGCLWALKHHDLALVSPFAGTGQLNYDFRKKSRDFRQKNRKKLWSDYDFCCVVMPRSTYDILGPFDENYLVGGYEDTDYAYRLREKGLKYGVTGAAYIHHFGSQTLGEFKRRGDKHAAHNKQYFIGKWKEDPSRFAGTLRGKTRKSWRRLKLKFGWM